MHGGANDRALTAACADQAAGKVKRKVVTPLLEIAEISPPWASMMVRLIASPIPMPWGLVVTNG